MECTPTTALPASPCVTVSPHSLLAAFATLPDPRRQASVDYPLPALLALAVTAILANQHSPVAIAQWAARQGAALLAPFGFPGGRTPCQSTLHRLFAQLDADRLSGALRAHFAPAAAPDPAMRGSQGIAIDGKAQRGRRQYQPGGSPVHALTALCHEQGIVLAQEPIDAGPAKHEAELTVAPVLIARLDWRGRVLTGDALLCQRAICDQVRAAEGDDLLWVKEHQPTLYGDIRLLFDPPADEPAPLPLLDRRETRTVERGHGRDDDTRHLVASTDLTGYSDWPGLAQHPHAGTRRLEHTWREHGQQKRALHYGITSLPPDIGTPARLLELKRGHWGIEHCLHRVKDVVCGEDQSLIHVGAGPTVMAMLRDTAISLLHRAGWRAIASRLRAHADAPLAALALVIGPPGPHA